MSGIAKIGLRLVETIKTTKCITKNNTTKNIRSMCHVKNGFSNITKNSIPPGKSCNYKFKFLNINIVYNIYYLLNYNYRWKF